MSSRFPPGRRVPLWLVLLWLVPLWCPAALPAAPPWPDEARQRLSVGIRLLPACLAADRNLDRRLTPEGELLVLVVYRDDPDGAAEVAGRLRHQERLRNLPLRVEPVPVAQLPQRAGQPIAGLLLAEPGIPALAELAVQLKTLVFSPFVGDVERGAVTGIHVSERLLPYVNLTQARRAGVRFKPFFLQVARSHE